MTACTCQSSSKRLACGRHQLGPGFLRGRVVLTGKRPAAVELSTKWTCAHTVNSFTKADYLLIT